MPLPDYPILGLHFRLTGGGETAAFQEATGISLKMDTESYREGGENRFDHRLPTGVKYEPLKLVRGLMEEDGELSKWCRSVLQGNITMPIATKTLVLELLEIQDAEKILKKWTFNNAWPIHWEVSGLHSTDGKIVVETLELSYNYFDQDKEQRFA
jgi:phage tail-like protein